MIPFKEKDSNSNDIVLLATISGSAIYTVLSAPLLFLAIGYFAFSNLSLQQVFSYKNITASTPWRPIPILSLSFVILFVWIMARWARNLLAARGKYLWIQNDGLMLGSKEIADLRDLDPYKIDFHGDRLRRYISIGRSSGQPVEVQLTLCNYDEHDLIERLRAAIELR
jgi:hypothetical protein